MLSQPFRIAAVVAPLLIASLADAQSRRPTRYYPATPTTSRYLAVFNDGGGSVSNYFGLIRPQQRLSDYSRAQGEQLRLQQRQIDQITPGTPEGAPRPTGQAGWFRVGSPRNAFGDTSHYFFRWDERRSPVRP